MAVNRIYYALTNIIYYREATGTLPAGWAVLGGGQSAGITSTVNIENFSAFGSLISPTQINDVDFELTVERLLTHDSGSLIGLLSTDAVQADLVLGFNGMDPDKVIRMGLVYTIPATSKTGSNTKNVLLLDCVPSSYSMNCGLDGGLTESMTFQNAGNAVVSNVSSLPGAGGISIPAIESAMKNIITRKDFRQMNFRRAYNGETKDWPASNVQSVGCSMDFSTEKLNALGNSLPIAKYATYPIECSMEVEEHVDPTENMFGSPVETEVNPTTNAIVGIKDIYWNPQIIFGRATTSDTCGGVATDNIQGYAHHWQLGCARMTGRNLSGGDAGGGNATMQTTFTAYNSLSYMSRTGTDMSSITTNPPQYNLDPSVFNIPQIPTTPSPSGNFMKFDDGIWTEDPPGLIG